MDLSFDRVLWSRQLHHRERAAGAGCRAPVAGFALRRYAVGHDDDVAVHFSALHREVFVVLRLEAELHAPAQRVGWVGALAVLERLDDGFAELGAHRIVDVLQRSLRLATAELHHREGTLEPAQHLRHQHQRCEHGVALRARHGATVVQAEAELDHRRRCARLITIAALPMPAACACLLQAGANARQQNASILFHGLQSGKHSVCGLV